MPEKFEWRSSVDTRHACIFVNMCMLLHIFLKLPSNMKEVMTWTFASVVQGTMQLLALSFLLLESLPANSFVLSLNNGRELSC